MNRSNLRAWGHNGGCPTTATLTLPLLVLLLCFMVFIFKAVFLINANNQKQSTCYICNTWSSRPQLNQYLYRFQWNSIVLSHFYRDKFIREKWNSTHVYTINQWSSLWLSPSFRGCRSREDNLLWLSKSKCFILL